MNTIRFLSILIVLGLVTLACGFTTNEISNSGDVETEDELPELPSGWIWAESPELGLIAVAGSIQAGQLQYFAIAEEAVAGITEAMKVYSVSASQFVFQGILLPASVASFGLGGGLQDMVEGPTVFVNNGRIITINRATRQIQVVQLEAADADAAESAVEGEQVGAEVRKEEKVNTQRRIAHVEDDRSWQKIGSGLFGGEVVVFSSCEELITALTSNPSLNFSAYVLDNDLGSGMRGPTCVQQILTLRPGSVIVGLSGGFDDPGFVDSGAKSWISKTRVDPETFRNLLP